MMKTSKPRHLVRRVGLGLALAVAFGLWLPELARSEEPAGASKGAKADSGGKPAGGERASPAASAGPAVGAGEAPATPAPSPASPAAAATKAGVPAVEGERPPPGGGYTLAEPSGAANNKAALGGGVAHAGQPTPGGCPVCPVSSKEDLTVLMKLRERHTLLSARENLVSQKEAALTKLEASLDAQLTRFDVAIAKIEARLEVGDAKRIKRDGQVQALVQTLQGLSAKKAAPMLAEAQPDLVAEIFRQLGPVRVASLLSVMPPGKAGKLIDLSVDRASVPKAARPATAPPSPKPRTPAPSAPTAPANEGAK